MSAAGADFWERLAGHLRRGRPVLLGVVAESSVHSPGTSGARIFVTAGDEGRVDREGTIGGGVMELRLVERAAEILHDADGPWAERSELHHRRRLDSELEDDATAERSGMICAGSQTNLYVALDPQRDGATAEEIASRLRQGRGGSWSLDSTGAFAVAGDDLDVPRRLEREDPGEGWTFRESLVERRRVAVLGGGHCGQALARLMADLGWHVSLWETRAAIAEEIRRREALRGRVEVHEIDDFRRAGPAIDRPETTAVVVMTTDVPNDVRALFGVLEGGRPFPFVGAMGSEAKLDEIRRRLRYLGLVDADLERLTAPVGLPIGSDTPPEIAVSVAAQLLERRHEWLGEAVSR